MREGKLLKSEVVCRHGERFYVKKVGFKDWHIDFCNITVRLEDCTYTLIRQVDVIALVRSFRPISVDEFDRIARPLIM